MIAVLFIALGLAIAALGIWTATQRPRPASLAGAVVAAVGLALAFLGAFRLVVPTLF